MAVLESWEEPHEQESRSKALFGALQAVVAKYPGPLLRIIIVGFHPEKFDVRIWRYESPYRDRYGFDSVRQIADPTKERILEAVEAWAAKGYPEK